MYEERKALTYHPEMVKETIVFALENGSLYVDVAIKLLEFLLDVS